MVLFLCDEKLGATVTGIVFIIGYVLDRSKGSNPTYSAVDYRYSMIASVISVLIGIVVLALLKLPGIAVNNQQVGTPSNQQGQQNRDTEKQTKLKEEKQ